MTLGQKVKAARKQKKITQKMLAGDKITRNMISRIESDIASPSLDTLKYLSSALSVPIGYLLSEDDDLFFYEKSEKIGAIYEAYSHADYSYCVNKIKGLSSIDNELAYIMAVSYFQMGKGALLRGALISAIKNLNEAAVYCDKTIYDTRHVSALIDMYRSVATNIQSPLLEFDSRKFEDGMCSVFDYELYKYLIQDYEYAFTDPGIKNHVAAKKLMKERRYTDAVKLLLESADSFIKKDYNAFVIFGIYSDLEQCYKQLYDFENAYKYSSKRMSMLEGFKS